MRSLPSGVQPRYLVIETLAADQCAEIRRKLCLKSRRIDRAGSTGDHVAGKKPQIMFNFDQVARERPDRQPHMQRFVGTILSQVSLDAGPGYIDIPELAGGS